MLDSARVLTAPCPVCGAAGGVPELSAILSGNEVHILRCGCGLRYLGDWPRHYSEALYDYYGDEGWLAGHEESPITAERYRVLLRRWAGLVDGRDLLDLGCGAGEFVSAAIEAGWNARGIELSAPAVAYCQARGLPVDRTDLFSDDLEPGSFDLCTLFEVIEHVPDPPGFLKRTAELTRPGGLVYLTTPNFASLDRRVLGADWNGVHIEHLSYFTPSTLRHLIASSGLETIELNTRNVSGAALRRLLGQRQARADHQAETALRQAVEVSPVLRTAKALANGVLGLASWGSAMTALCRRPA